MPIGGCTLSIYEKTDEES